MSYSVSCGLPLAATQRQLIDVTRGFDISVLDTLIIAAFPSLFYNPLLHPAM